MRRPLLLLLVPVVAGLAACGGPPASSTAAPVAEPATSAVAPATSAPATSALAPVVTPDPLPAPVTGSASDAPSSWVMPNLVGSVLQDAQDRIQELTGNPLFITRSHDASGKGRHQVLDRDWRVCDQNVAPGRAITAESTIDFGAVKLAERC